MQAGCYLAAIALPGYLLITKQAAEISTSIVALVALFFVAAGLLTAPSRASTTRPKDSRDEDDDDDASGSEAELAQEVRRVVRRYTAWPPRDERVAVVWQ